MTTTNVIVNKDGTKNLENTVKIAPFLSVTTNNNENSVKINFSSGNLTLSGGDSKEGLTSSLTGSNANGQSLSASISYLPSKPVVEGTAVVAGGAAAIGITLLGQPEVGIGIYKLATGSN